MPEAWGFEQVGAGRGGFIFKRRNNRGRSYEVMTCPAAAIWTQR